MRRSVVPVVALVAWTVLVWTARIGNIWRDDDLDTSGKLGRTLLALSFTALAGAVLVTWRGRRGAWQKAVLALAAWTVAVWLVRDVKIVFGDHDIGFKLVHTVLAVVSIVLAAWAALSLRAPTADSSDDGDAAAGDDTTSGFGLPAAEG